MIINPFVVRAWLEGGGGGGGDASTLMQIITPLGYHYVPGMITLGLASLALGMLFAQRAQARPIDHTRRDDERRRLAQRPARERTTVGATRD